jgi:hypothetical protein
MYYDYVSNSTDIFNLFYEKNNYRGDDITRTWLMFYSNNINVYEGPKGDYGKSNKKEFDYKRAIL